MRKHAWLLVLLLFTTVSVAGYYEVSAPAVGAARSEAQSASFGEVVTAHLEPRVQIDAVYGILASDHETFTSGAGSQATASGGVFVVDNGTDVGGYGTIRSNRLGRYRPGQGMRARWTAAHDACQALYLSGSGIFTSTDGLWVGCLNADFGFTRRVAGAPEIRTLTITGGATGAGTIGVELDGTTTNVTIGGALSAAATCETIAQETFTGWDVECVDAVVTFESTAIEAKAGAFSFSAGATGATATGPTQVLAGAPNDHTTYFVAQTSWNVDRMDGKGPSGVNLDQTKLNVYQLTYPYLGAGTITLSVMDPRTGVFFPAHRIAYPNTATVPHTVNPTYRVGWFSASLGTTTSAEVKGASGAIFVEGVRAPLRNPSATERTATGVSSEVAVLSIRNSRVFAGVQNQREVEPKFLTVALDGTKPGTIDVYLDATLSGTPNWQAVAADSCVHVEKTNGLTLTNGLLVATLAVEGGTSASIDLDRLDLRLEPGEQLVVAAEVDGGPGSDLTVALDWQED